MELDIFDCNVRLGTRSAPPPEHLSTVPELLAEMDRVGVREALVCHFWAEEWNPGAGNTRLLEEIAGQERLYPCLVGLPEATGEMDPVELAETAQRLHGAVRVFPALHQFRLTPWNLGGLLEALQERGVPLLVELAQTDWRDIEETLRAFPELPLVLLNLSYRQDRYLYALWENHSHLYVELGSYVGFCTLEETVAHFGAGRLLFGSDLPTRDPAVPIALLTYAERSDSDKAQVAGGTMRRLLGIGGEQ